ncbi:DUF3800 domain-containing protein [Limobrevibacterium gyesilva]|uniref:DUF3800 domain-containing protein n=1 Tax=Limobrevibacterium gyesilva TaxID=2991712 RepID=UPI0022267652|nr:DUF3800 domain-containing protein [Limobrevibacterium gyesilva]
MQHIYIDESSQTQNRFLVLGGINVPSETVQHLEDEIRRSRLPALPYGEMKWQKVSTSKLDTYKRVSDVVLSPSQGPLRAIEFHSLVVDTRKLKDKTFNKGSREVGFNKEIYQLCQKFGRIHRSALFHVYLDNRDTNSSTNELRNILNFGIRSGQADRDWPYRRVHFRNSSDCLSLQIVDLFLGAIAFKLNGHYAAIGASESKRSLSDFILQKAGVRSVEKDTAVRGRFTIWHRQLK